MDLIKFEEKVDKLFKKYNIVNIDTEVNKGSNFYMDVMSYYKHKELYFYGTNFMFRVEEANLDDLFNKAYKIVKSFVVKSVETEVTPEVVSEGTV